MNQQETAKALSETEQKSDLRGIQLSLIALTDDERATLYRLCMTARMRGLGASEESNKAYLEELTGDICGSMVQVWIDALARVTGYDRGNTVSPI